MKLALKHAPPPGLLPRLFHAITAYRLVTKYPHSGVVIGDQLLHATLKKGVHAETFLPGGWDLFDIPGLDERLVWDRFEAVEGLPYDIFSQLAFVIPHSASDAKRMYCYELSRYLLTGEMLRTRAVPEDLLALIAPKT